jgi:hypothetical protein
VVELELPFGPTSRRRSNAPAHDWRWLSCHVYFILNHASPLRLIPLISFRFPLRSLPSFPLPVCAESLPSSRRGTPTNLNVVPLPTVPTQVHPQIHPSRNSHTESPLVAFLPSPGLVSQQIDRRGPRSQLTHHRPPRRAQSRFAHQMMTVLPI